MDINERRILVFTGLGHFFTHFTMLLFPPLVTTIARDLGMELDRVFSISFLMYLLYGVCAIPWGLLADRWNPRFTLALGIIVAGIGLLGAGLVRSPRMLSISLAVVGIGNSAYHPTGLALLSKGMRLRGRGLGLNGIFGNLGIALAPFSAGILGWVVGWKITLVFFGVVGILWGLLVVMMPFSIPRLGDRQRGEGVSGQNALVLFLILCAVVVFAGLMYRSFTLVLPSWLEFKFTDDFDKIRNLFGELGKTPAEMSFGGLMAALATGLAMIVGMIGQLAGGRIADRMDLRKAYLLFFSLSLPFLLLARLVPGWTSLPLLGMFTFFALGLQPIENSLYSMLIPSKWRSSGFGIKFTLGFGVGSIAVANVSRFEPRIGLDGIVSLIIVFLFLTIATSLVLLLTSRGAVIRHMTGEIV